MTTSPPLPSAAQQAFEALGTGLFIHFGINTYYDREWSDGTLDPARYNPAQFDPDGWCRAARAAGMRSLIFTTKHVDGFCNWPSHHTDYCVTRTPYRGDPLAQVAEACARHGLKLGLYYALWDLHHDRDDARYADFVQAQIAELLGHYGPILELWFDGAWTKFTRGYLPQANQLTDMWRFDGTPAELIDCWRQQCAPRWGYDALYAHIKSLQPDCLVLNNTTTDFPGLPFWPVDVRTGEKATELITQDQKLWPWAGQMHYLPLQVETTLSQSGPPGPFANGSWFWHPWDHSVATHAQIRHWQAAARAQQAVLLLNAGVMANGQLRPEDDSALRQMGA